MLPRGRPQLLLDLQAGSVLRRFEREDHRALRRGLARPRPPRPAQLGGSWGALIHYPSLRRSTPRSTSSPGTRPVLASLPEHPRPVRCGLGRGRRRHSHHDASSVKTAEGTSSATPTAWPAGPDVPVAGRSFPRDASPAVGAAACHPDVRQPQGGRQLPLFRTGRGDHGSGGERYSRASVCSVSLREQ